MADSLLGFSRQAARPNHVSRVQIREMHGLVKGSAITPRVRKSSRMGSQFSFWPEIAPAPALTPSAARAASASKLKGLLRRNPTKLPERPAFSRKGTSASLRRCGYTTGRGFLGWPGYRVYRMEIDEQGKKLKLWVRRKKAGLKLICSRCGEHVPASKIHEVCEREVRGPALL